MTIVKMIETSTGVFSEGQSEGLVLSFVEKDRTRQSITTVGVSLEVGTPFCSTTSDSMAFRSSCLISRERFHA